ncbi:MAG: hypothetical protein ACM336_16305 [Acidobacteriota bacterium]
MALSDEGPVDKTEERLQAMFAAYRDACPAPEPGPDFMPQLWRKIDAGRSFPFGLRRLAQGIITAAAAAALIMGVALTSYEPLQPTYLETLAAGQADNLADSEIALALHDNSR